MQATRAPEPVGESRLPRGGRHRSRWRIVGVVTLVLVVLLGGARLMLPRWVQSYVNRTLDQAQLYRGRIGQVRLYLWRGGYSIEDVRLIKITGDVPVPLFSAKRVDLSVQWNALLHRRIVGKIVMEQPELNFVDAPDSSDAQSGAGGPWLKIIQDLFPFRINSARIHNGSIHFRTFQAVRPVDVYLSQVEATVDDLSNIRDATTPLVTTIRATARAMGDARFEFQMKLDPTSYYPTFHMAVRLLGLDVTKINDLALAYGQFDFKRGWLDLVIEVDAKQGQIVGYVKPLFRNLQVFYLPQDLREDNPLQFFWQALVGLATQVLKNQPRDQFGTLIPFRGDVTGSKPDILATIGNVLRNAFIRAYLPKLQSGNAVVAPGGTPAASAESQGIEFEPPSPIDAASTGDDQP